MSGNPPWYGFPPVTAASLGITTDDVANLSGVPGANATAALDALNALIAALTSTSIANASGVAGAKVTDALNTLNAGIAANVASIAALQVQNAYVQAAERWYPPTVAHADDEEFTKTLAQLLAAGWNLYDSSGNTVAILDDTIDVYSNDVTNQHINGNTFRASWLTAKARNNNTRYYFMKPITLGTNELAWARVGQKIIAVNDAADIGLVLCPAQAGPKPDFTDATRIEVIWVDIAGGRSLRYRINAANVFNGGPYSDGLEGMPYIGLGKIGTTYHAWCGPEGQSQPQYLGSGVQAATMAYVGFVFQVNDASPGNGTVAADFLRFKNTSTETF